MKKNTNNFTLVELLIVIAIIAILASMLLPALTKAKNKAYDIYCRSQLHNIGQIMLIYSSDYDGYIPKHNDTTSYWRRHLFDSYNNTFTNITNTSEIAKLMAKNSYKIFWCPEYIRKYSSKQSYFGRGSYALNGYFDGEYRKLMPKQGKYEPLVVDGMPVPAWQSSWGTGKLEHAACGLVGGPGVYHGRLSGNALYIDGHVEVINDKITRTPNPALNNLTIHNAVADKTNFL